VNELQATLPSIAPDTEACIFGLSVLRICRLFSGTSVFTRFTKPDMVALKVLRNKTSQLSQPNGLSSSIARHFFLGKEIPDFQPMGAIKMEGWKKMASSL
jgi:hypothetical protein